MMLRLRALINIPGHAKLKAREFGNALLVNGEAVHFDSASLEQAKLKLGKLLKKKGF